MHEAQVTITIPDGYELAEVKARFPKAGEWFINSEGQAVLACFDFQGFACPILRKVEPLKSGTVCMSYGNVGWVAADGSFVAPMVGSARLHRGPLQKQQELVTHFDSLTVTGQQAIRETIARRDPLHVLQLILADELAKEKP